MISAARVGEQASQAGPFNQWPIGMGFEYFYGFVGAIPAVAIEPVPPHNYNFDKGWYVLSSPIITANWEADGSDNTWTVPLGGGGGRIIRIGKLPVNLNAQSFYNVVKPDDDPTADWTLRLQFLFPK